MSEIFCALGVNFMNDIKASMEKYKIISKITSNQEFEDKYQFHTQISLNLKSVNIEELTRLAEEAAETFWGNPEAIIDLIHEEVTRELDSYFAEQFKVSMVRIIDLDILLAPVLPHPWWWCCLVPLHGFNHLKHDTEFKTHIVGVLHKI